MSDLLNDNPDVMGSLLRALCDPGQITPRAPLETLESWQRRAVIEHAAPYICAAERERVAGLLDEASKAIMTQAVSLVSEGNEADGLPKVKMAASVSLAASLVRGKVPQQVSDLLPPGVLPGSAPESAP